MKNKVIFQTATKNFFSFDFESMFKDKKDEVLQLLSVLSGSNYDSARLVGGVVRDYILAFNQEEKTKINELIGNYNNQILEGAQLNKDTRHFQTRSLHE